LSNREIDHCTNLLKRDATPICIPPSWDLVQKYAGAHDENADGFDKDLYLKGKTNHVGDHGEATFLDTMRHLGGGILIGNIDWFQLTHAKKNNVLCRRLIDAKE
jgi:hypothetical protein